MIEYLKMFQLQQDNENLRNWVIGLEKENRELCNKSRQLHFYKAEALAARNLINEDLENIRNVESLRSYTKAFEQTIKEFGDEI